MKRLCLFAGFDKNNQVHDYVIYFIKNLTQFAEIHYLADCNMSESELMKLFPYVKSAAAYRHNKYDFGSWQGLINTLGWAYLENFDEVIMVNDSCFAPIFPFKEMFCKMESQNLDFWGNSLNIYTEETHIQSYFMVFNNKIIRNSLFRRFIENIKIEDSKHDVVLNYEMKLTDLLVNEGYKYNVYLNEKYEARTVYYKLLLEKSPFLKVKHYTNPKFIWASYPSLLILKMIGYPSEYIFAYLNKNFGFELLPLNLFRSLNNILFNNILIRKIRNRIRKSFIRSRS